MRKILIPMLMASVLIPATASAAPGERGSRSYSERSAKSEKSDNSSSDRPQRAERSDRSSRDVSRSQVQRTGRPQRTERAVTVQSSERSQVRRFEGQRSSGAVQQVRRVERRDGGNDGFVSGIRQAGRTKLARQRGETATRTYRDGDRRWDGNRDNDRNWSRDWRRDSRYDWSSYRNRYNSLFRLGRYYDPYGYNYRRFSIGFNLWPSYYSSNFWLNDPWQYRLPPAYGPYQWVRYYDDALLVNTYTGEVVDVIYNVFW